MAYEVTAARRRPQKFEDLIGQEFVTATLVNAIAEGKIAHAYLFSGPRGCGKTSTARILAKVLNCMDLKDGAPCGICSSCIEVVKGASLDVIEIDGASNTSVNDVRQIKDEVLFPPNSSKYKIYIIDEVHMLSTNAFNALLKTIEEPPPYVIFVFATTELHKVPATIKSRCQQFHFRLGSIEQIKDLLAQAATESNIQADEEALYWIARESTGSFRDAYTLFDQVAAFSEGNITYEKIRDKLGLVGVERLNSLCELCVDGNTSAVIDFLDEVLQTGVSIEQFVSNTADYIRSLLFIKNGITKESLLGQSVQRFSNKVIEAWNSVQLERALSLFLQLYRDVRYSLSPRFELELALSRLCWLKDWVSNDEVKHAVDQAKKLFSGSTIVHEQPKAQQVQPVTDNPFANRMFQMRSDESQSTETVEPPTQRESLAIPLQENKKEEIESTPVSQTIDNEEQLKTIAVDIIKKQKVILASALSNAENWTIDDKNVYITVETVFVQQQLVSEHIFINNTLSKLLGKQIEIKVIIKHIDAEPEETMQIPETVQTILNTFDAEIISVQDSAPTRTEN